MSETEKQQKKADLDLNLHLKQSLCFHSPADEILYGGSAGGGKSMLMRMASIMWCQEIPGLQVYLFRRLSDDLVKNHIEGAGGYRVLLADLIDRGFCKYNESKNIISFSNGSKIYLCHCQHEKDVSKYLGAEIHLLLIDELTHFTEKIYRFLRNRCRLGGLKVPAKYKKMFPRIINGSNPTGIGHNWVKRTFVDMPSEPVEGAVMPIPEIDRKCKKYIKNITNRGLKEKGSMHINYMPPEEGGMRRQYIPARLADNPTQDQDYENKLKGLGAEHLVKAMLDGDWNIVAGGAFDDVWSKDCILPRFKIPKGWYLDRSFDWGSSTPFSVGWWAESNGEEATLTNGDTILVPAGSLIRIAEWYGCEQGQTNKGLRLSTEEIAQGIIEREKQLLKSGWIEGRINAGVADNQIFNHNEAGTKSFAEKMESVGIYWTRSNKSAGSRVTGFQIIRDMLKNCSDEEKEGLYFFENCTDSIKSIPILQRSEKNEEDVHKGGEDHQYDEIRYRVLDKKEIGVDIDFIR